MKKIVSSASAAALLVAGSLAAAAPASAATVSPAPAKAAYDLAPSFTVSGMKAKGFAGLVAVHVKNVGSQRYYSDFPNVSFKVEVKTASGPQGVDRLVTPGWFNGAYTEDYGYDLATGTRTFIVSLANPINPGQDVVIANLDFGDGLTKEGRIVNYVKVSQLGRVAQDKSTANDQNIDSRTATVTDTGRPNAGLF